MKRLMKVFSGGSAMWREWRMIRLLKGSVGVCAGSRPVGGPRMRWIDTMKDCLRKKVCTLGKQGEWCR